MTSISHPQHQHPHNRTVRTVFFVAITTRCSRASGPNLRLLAAETGAWFRACRRRWWTLKKPQVVALICVSAYSTCIVGPSTHCKCLGGIGQRLMERNMYHRSVIGRKIYERVCTVAREKNGRADCIPCRIRQCVRRKNRKHRLDQRALNNAIVLRFSRWMLRRLGGIREHSVSLESCVKAACLQSRNRQRYASLVKRAQVLANKMQCHALLYGDGLLRLA